MTKTVRKRKIIYKNVRFDITTFRVDIKYENKDHTKPVYVCPNANNNCKTVSIPGVTAGEYKHFSTTFTINNSSPYVSFNIVEDAGENNITTINLGECEKKLKEHYNIPLDKNIILSSFSYQSNLASM